MLTIDSQVHVYERDHPRRPWRAALHGPAEVTGRDMVSAMDEAGVDGALLVSAFTIYGYDPSYAITVHSDYAGRFGLVAPIDPTDPRAEDKVAAWKAVDGAVAIRLVLTHGLSEDPADAGLARVLTAAARHGLPVNLLCWGRLDQVGELAARHPDTLLVIDHLGLPQSFEPPPPASFVELPKVLALANHANVAIKISGVCTLSREPFPYSDLWEPLGRVFDRFGFDRCMWGSDWTRAISFLTYRQAVDAFRLTDRLSSDERAALMGGTLARIYRWSPSGPARSCGSGSPSHG